MDNSQKQDRRNPPLNKQAQQDKSQSNLIKLININCRSSKINKYHIHALIAEENSDIIVGTESWLKENDSDEECAPKDQYQVFRKDRVHKKGGGVFIALRRSLIASEIPELSTDCEIIWCKITLTNKKTLQVAAFYRPNEGDGKSLDELKKSHWRW